MSTYGAILGASIGVILLCLVVMVACYVLYAVSHMKALKALGYKKCMACMDSIRCILCMCGCSSRGGRREGKVIWKP